MFMLIVTSKLVVHSYQNIFSFELLNNQSGFSKQILFCNSQSSVRLLSNLLITELLQLATSQRTQTSLRRLQDVLKRSQRLTTKPDVVRTSGKRLLN